MRKLGFILGKLGASMVAPLLLAGCGSGQDVGLERRLDALVVRLGDGGTLNWKDVAPGDWTRVVVLVPCASTADEINDGLGLTWDHAGAVAGGTECVSSDRWVYLAAFEKGDSVVSWGLLNHAADGTDLLFPDDFSVGPDETLRLRRNVGQDTWEIGQAR